MLGFLPTPGADELLYSIVARYGAMTGRRVGSQLILDFFGTPVGVTAVDLPNHIDSMVARLPPGCVLDRDRLIEGHTLFPYELRFAPAPVTDAVRAYMAGDSRRRTARIGVMSTAFPPRERMMACKACAREDAKGTGIATWRRVHQLPGVLVCPRHGTVLAETAVARLDRRGRGALVPLTAEVWKAARPLKVPRGTRDDLHRFALGGKRLLQQDYQPCKVGTVSRRLRELLAGYRWSRAPSLLHTSAIAEEFGSHPSVRRLMSAIEVNWSDATTATAMNRLLYRDEAPKHPLMVLMTLELAGASLDDLFRPEAPEVQVPERLTSSARVSTEVSHELPCGNPACRRFAGRLPGALADVRRPAARIRAACLDCGYVYAWDDRRPGAICVVETGALWDEMLASVMVQGLGTRAAGRALGVSPTTVMRHARRLGLWREGWKDRPKVQLRQETAGVLSVFLHDCGP